MNPLLRSLVAPIGERVLHSRKVYLRAPQLRDFEPWTAVREESRDFLIPWEPTWPHDALTRAAFRRRLRRYEQDARDDAGYAFFVFLRGDDTLVGGVTLSNVRRGVTQSCSMGYWMGQACARNGYMRDALHALIPFIFDEMGLHRIEAACIPTNAPSRRLLHTLGFTREGYARQYLCINGVWQDHLLFAMLATDLRPGSNAAAALIGEGALGKG